MAAPPIPLSDLRRDPGDVARSLPAWRRGDPDEAVVATLAASARDLHARAYTLWAWSGHSTGGAPAWALAVPARIAIEFYPRGPARALARSLEAAVTCGARSERVRFNDWHGFVCLELDGIDEELAELVLAEAHPAPARAALAALPPEVVLGGPALPLAPPSSPDGDGVRALAHAIGVHPVRVALSLAAQGMPVDEPSYPLGLVRSLRDWGLSAEAAAGGVPDEAPPSLAIDDDPCPRRRHARKILRRLFHMRKIGSQRHTAFENLYRGAPADARRDALDVGEALLRAGLLGEKPSVGQRHVYLRREALPEIHALIERGETLSSQLAEMWTAPAPGDVTPAPGDGEAPEATLTAAPEP